MKKKTEDCSHRTQSNPIHKVSSKSWPNPIQSNPTQSNPWMDPIHVQLWVGLCQMTFWKIQLIQNAVARLVIGTRRCDHITPVLRQCTGFLFVDELTTRLQHAPVASGSDTCIPGWRPPTRDGHWSPSSAFNCRQDMLRPTDTQQFRRS